MTKFSILIISMLLTACSQQLETDSQQLETEVSSNSSAVDGKSILETIKFALDPDKFKNCKRSDLEPLDQVWTLNDSEQIIADDISAEKSTSELTAATIEFASVSDDELTARERESITMYLFKLAAEDDDPIALNEIGASLLFCHQHVAQDTERAAIYLKRAYDGGDPYAAHSLAIMYAAGWISDDSREERAKELFEKCRLMGHPEC